MNYSLQNLKTHSLSYKYFYNKEIVFVTSAKVGSRFMKSVSDILNFNLFDYPINSKLKEYQIRHSEFRHDSLFINSRINYLNIIYNELFKGKKVVFLIREPNSKFISGLTTNFGNIETRLFKYAEDGKDFMRSYFDGKISEKDFEMGILDIKEKYEKYLTKGDSDGIRDIIEKYFLTHAIHKDSHVEYYNYITYCYFNELKVLGIEANYLDIKNLDTYFKSKQIKEWNYDENMLPLRESEKETPIYQFIKDRLEIWKSEIKNLSLYFDIETIHYEKIKKEYEILL